MDLIHALILGILEGLTEFLPISSTGHLILAAELLKIGNSDFVKTFEVVIQLGAVLAVVVLYPVRLFADIPTQLRVAAAFIPTGILGFLLHDFVKAHLFGNIPVILSALVVGGLIIIGLERWFARSAFSGCEIVQLPLSRTFGIGVIQALAFIPGVSRAGATILGGMVSGLSRSAAVEFSFLLAVPVMVAATGLDLFRSGPAFAHADWLTLGTGFISAFIVGLAVMIILVKYVKTHTLEPFAYYRILLAGLLFLVLF